MSGIAAIIQFDGAPADRRSVEKMTHVMAYRGPDGIATLETGPAVLGHCMLHSTAEALDEQQPLTNDDNSLTLIMDGYLTNWEELRQDLKERGAHLRTRTDAELVLRAYEVWGRDCVRHIDGEFAFLVWDGRRREAFCARDHQGLRPLFYRWDKQRLIVASDISAIMAVLPERPPLNHGFLAEMMAEQWDSRTETVWMGIERVPPAHCLRVGAGGLEPEGYWTLPLDVTIKYAREEDYFEHYRDLLSDCMRRSSRTHRPLAFEVSGGLDSSSLFCLADHMLREGRLLAPNIQGYTLQGPSGSDADEIRFARAAGRHIGRPVTEVPLHMPGLEWFQRQAQVDCDVPGYPNGVMSIGLEKTARRDNCRVLVNGLGGDQWLDGSTAYYREQLEERDWRGLAESLCEDGRHLGWASTGKLLARALAANALPEKVLCGLRSLIAKHAEQPFWLSAQSRAELARRQADYEAQLRSRGRWHYKEFKLYFPFNLVAFDLIVRQRARSGLESRSPMLMRSFIEFSAATPERLRLRGGVTKMIHRKALAGILPDLILERQSKAEFSVTWRALQKELLAWLRARSPADLSPNLDRAGMRRMVAIEGNSEIDETPFWELWAIFIACVLTYQDSLSANVRVNSDHE